MKYPHTLTSEQFAIISVALDVALEREEAYIAAHNEGRPTDQLDAVTELRKLWGFAGPVVIAARGRAHPSTADIVADKQKLIDELTSDIAALESGKMWHEAATERERIRSLLAKACDVLEDSGRKDVAARLRQQGGAP